MQLVLSAQSDGDNLTQVSQPVFLAFTWSVQSSAVGHLSLSSSGKLANVETTRKNIDTLSCKMNISFLLFLLNCL